MRVGRVVFKFTFMLIITGKDAKRFIKNAKKAEKTKVSKEELDRVKANYNKLKSIFKG